jgi:signal transduction histidine kinase
MSGEAATSRRLRAAARSLLEGGFDAADDSSHVRAVAVSRWDRPFAALVGRGRPETSGRLAVYLSAAASALSPLFERELLFERSAARERVLVSATERRLLRLGCDLHDGPLQEIVAFADDLRLARDQVVSLLDSSEGVRVRGRFADLEARLASLDGGLRDISHAVRSTSAIEQPLEHVLRREVDALGRATGIETDLAVDGDVSTLTESQKIALFRVVQESLSNARKHSNATRVLVRLRSATAYVSVTVSDDGCGFDAERSPGSERLGLVGVVERVRLLGGDVEIESAPGEGVVVRATLPRWRPVENTTASFYAVT